MKKSTSFIVFLLLPLLFITCKYNSQNNSQNLKLHEQDKTTQSPIISDSSTMFIGKNDKVITLYWEQATTEKMKNMIADLVKNMVLVEGGTFMMGCNDSSLNCESVECPSHQVYVDSFFLCKFEVMQKLWATFMLEEAPINFQNANPVTNVSWNECISFIEKINRISGLKFRLPTEAEWEFAARGGRYSENSIYAGSNEANLIGWDYHNSNWSSHEVAKKKANEIGLFDMSGNVSEWCSDWFAPYSDVPQNNPPGAETGDAKVFRGGGFTDMENKLRVSYRNASPPDYKMNFLGFRLALDK